ncbi:MAG: LON peptidase substrate-binding domain-containing protein [Verrucomicrobia bacterium]|nr:LON peptidase substrate-binding domain-containing protein [Verrucomicrobiota bacterium]
MTLGETVFFPHVVLPLHIFESRYRQMLSDCLSGNRMFVVSCRADDPDGKFAGNDPQPHEIATVGMIRAAHRNADGTSNLVLQGLQRVRILDIVREEPYRLVSIEPLESGQPTDCEEIKALRSQICQLLHCDTEMENETPVEFLGFLESLQDSATFIDLLTYSVCTCAKAKQAVLEALDVTDRFRILHNHLVHKHNLESLISELEMRVEPGTTGLN